jgi:glycosyltransferase involved in cell wall biosynthesis
MERYALVVSATLRQLGLRVVFHTREVNEAVAASIGVEVRNVTINRFPRKLRDFRFFRQINRSIGQAVGRQIALSRVRAKDVMVCGGTHLGYLHHARKVVGPFDLLQIWMEREAYRYARVVVSHSDLCRRDLEHWYRVPGQKITTLYPPVDSQLTPARDAAERVASRRKLALPLDKVVMLFPSTGHRRKGLNPICHALEALPDKVVLAVAGKPPSGRNWPFVRYLGYIENMAVAYHAADYTVLGSYYEPFGLVGPESLLCGTRLVFDENIGCLSAVKPEFVFTFSVWDIETIRRAVSAAVALAQLGDHHLSQPAEALRYDASPLAHTQALLEVLGL